MVLPSPTPRDENVKLGWLVSSKKKKWISSLSQMNDDIRVKYYKGRESLKINGCYLMCNLRPINE